MLRVLAGAAAHAVEPRQHILAGGAVGLEKVDDDLWGGRRVGAWGWKASALTELLLLLFEVAVLLLLLL